VSQVKGAKRTKKTRHKAPLASALPPITEAEVLSACLDCLKAFGVDVKRQNTGGSYRERKSGKPQYIKYGEPGDSDITGTLTTKYPDGRIIGRTLHLEIKRPGAFPTEAQLERLRQTNIAGGVGFWIDDAKRLSDILPKLIAGAWVEIDERGYPWLEDGKD
jgi:hypothetical protein